MNENKNATTAVLDQLFSRLVALYGQGLRGRKAGKLVEGKVAQQLIRAGMDVTAAHEAVRQTGYRAWEAAGGTATSFPPVRS